MSKSLQKKLIFEYLEKYSDVGSVALAKLIYKHHRSLFGNLEQVRYRLRYYRNETKDKPAQKKYFRELPPVAVNIKRLFFDIETSPNIVYSFQIGYNLNIGHEQIIEERKIICICWKWEHENKVHSVEWDSNKCDKKALEKFLKVANEADELIAHNGDRFDIKWIRTRCAFHGLPMLHKYQTLDTLKKAKSHFNFNSNKLDYIAKFFNVGQKIQHSGFSMWAECMKGNKEALKEMVHYCKGDCVVLEEVYNKMQQYVKHNYHLGVLNGGDRTDCPNCGDENTYLHSSNITASGTVKRMMCCNECLTNFEISNRVYLNSLKM